MTKLVSSEQQFQESREIARLLKLVVFTMGNLNLALPIKSVYKVVNHTPIYSSGVVPVGVTHLGDVEITVIDLYRRFFQESLANSSSGCNYLVIVQNTTGELYGIPVAETPILMEVPSSLIRVLPESYRRADTLDVASHVAVIPQETASLTVFLLDVELLLPLFQSLYVPQ